MERRGFRFCGLAFPARLFGRGRGALGAARLGGGALGAGGLRDFPDRFARRFSGATAVRLPDPLAAATGGDLLDGAAAHHRRGHLLQHIRVARAARRLVIRLDQQPGILLVLRPLAHAHQMPSAFELLAVEPEVQAALAIILVWIALRIPAAAIPDHDGAAAILTLRDRALERVVLDRMVLDMDRQALFARDQARPARHGPALHHPVELEPQIIVQPAGGVFLDDVAAALRARGAATRLRRHPEITLLPIDLQAHGSARGLEPHASHLLTNVRSPIAQPRHALSFFCS